MKNIKNVLIVNNLYCLLIYLLLKKEEIDETFFFFEDDVPDDIVRNFKFKTKIITTMSRFGQIALVLKLRFLVLTKYKFIRKASIYGQDNLLITSPLIGKSKMCVIEDGLANYTIPPSRRKFKLLKKILGGPLMSQETLGYSTCVNKLYLTGMAPIPEKLKGKVVVINLQQMWDSCQDFKKEQILKKFNISKELLEEFSSVTSILLTQPLSEDKAITEEEKISLYSNIISTSKIAIKPHPRERTNYKQYFPNATILEPYLPIELITLLGIRFKDVYTVFSTSALNMPGNPTIHFYGTRIHPALVEKWGDVRYENGKLTTQ